MQPDCRKCADEKEVLREEVRQLRADLAPPDAWVKIKTALTITTMEARFLSAFIHHGTRSHSQIMDVIYRDVPETPHSKTIGVFVHSLRQSGYKIKNVWGYGYSLPDEERSRIAKLLSV